MSENWLIEMLEEAYGSSTQNCTYFKDLVERINWDKTFEADGEMYFCKGRLTLTAESLDPFNQAWKPSIMIGNLCRELGR